MCNTCRKTFGKTIFRDGSMAAMRGVPPKGLKTGVVYQGFNFNDLKNIFLRIIDYWLKSKMPAKKG